MSLEFSAESTPFEADEKTIVTLITSLSHAGYKPLLREAKSTFIAALTGREDAFLSAETIDLDERLYRYAQMDVTDNECRRIPIAGDVFVPKARTGLLYLLLYSEDNEGEPSTAHEASRRLEAGCITGDYVIAELQEFLLTLSIALQEIGAEASWSRVQNRNQRFLILSRSKDLGFAPGDGMTDEEVRACDILSESHIREFAAVLKQSRQMSLADVPGAEMAWVSKLEAANLLTKEYVVICRQTSAPVNRLKRRERLEQISQMGVLCSCGNPIGSEKLEELLVATALLQRMLDRSFLISAKLMEALRRFGVSQDQFLFSMHDNPAQVEALIDLDGKLLFIEVHEENFSTRDAYRFAARLGSYKPDYSFILAAAGMAAGTKEQFNKMATEGRIACVTSLTDLMIALTRVVDEIRNAQIVAVLEQFETMAHIGVPVRDLLLARIQAPTQAEVKFGPQSVTTPYSVANVLP